jgi:type III secretory pathway component EscS
MARDMSARTLAVVVIISLGSLIVSEFVSLLIALTSLNI